MQKSRKNIQQTLNGHQKTPSDNARNEPGNRETSLKVTEPLSQNESTTIGIQLPDRTLSRNIAVEATENDVDDPHSITTRYGMVVFMKSS